MEILSPGEKIRKIRKDFKIRQQDVTGGEITRELISIVENDKGKLTPHVAQLIADNINLICKERNISFHLSADYLLEDVSAQVGKVCDEFIEFLQQNENNLSKNFTEDIKNIEAFLTKYDSPEKKIIIYEKLGDLLLNQKEFNKSYTFYIKAFENRNSEFDKVKLFTLLQKLGSICIRLGRYKEAIDYNNLALAYNINIPSDLKFKALFNNALAHIYLKDYDSALLQIQYIEDNFEGITRQKNLSLTIEKANCYRWKKFYTDSLRLNKNILKTLDDDEFEIKSLVTSNILDIYTVLKDGKNTEKYINKLIAEIMHFQEIDKCYYCTNCYHQIAISFNLIGNVELSKEYYKKAIDSVKRNRNIGELQNSLNEYLDIIIKEQDSDSVNDFKNHLLELVSLGLIERNTDIVFKLISYYNNINDRDSIHFLLAFILNEK